MSFVAAVLAAIGALRLFPLAAQGDLSWGVGAGFALQLPEGWRITEETPGWGLVLQPPKADAPRVELVTWLVSVGVEGPEEAAVEHERLIKAQAPYRRTNLSPFRSANAGEGVLVTGVITGAEGTEVGSLFAVFQRAGRAYVIGLFTDPARLASAVTDYLEPVTRGLTITRAEPIVAIAPAPAPRSVKEPVGLSSGSSFSGRAREKGPPLTPRQAQSAPEGVESVGRRVTHPSGLSLLVPAGWQAAISASAVCLSSPQGALCFAVPVSGKGQPAWIQALDIAIPWLQGLPNLKLLSFEQETVPDQRAVWGRFSAESDRERLEGRISFIAGDSTGVLLVVLGPEGQLGSLSGLAADVLASVEGELPVSSVETSVVGEYWRDSKGYLACDHLRGWTLDGGVSIYDNAPVISLSGRSTESSALWFTWRQPVRPIFRDLTEAMRKLGFRDGDDYYAYDGLSPRMIMTRALGAKALVELLLPEGASPLRGRHVADSRPVSSLGLLRPSDEHSELLIVTADSGPTGGCGWLLASHASAADRADGGFWEAACLGFGGLPGRWSEAADALEQAIRSASASPETPVHLRSALLALLERSRMAVESSGWRKLVGSGRWLPIVPPTTNRSARERLVVPPEVVEAWRALASGAPQS